MRHPFQVQCQLQKTGGSHVTSFSCRQEVTPVERDNQGQDKKSKSSPPSICYTRKAVNLNVQTSCGSDAPSGLTDTLLGVLVLLFLSHKTDLFILCITTLSTCNFFRATLSKLLREAISQNPNDFNFYIVILK